MNSAHSVFVYIGKAVTNFQPYMLPPIPWRLELAHGYSIVDQTAQ